MSSTAVTKQFYFRTPRLLGLRSATNPEYSFLSEYPKQFESTLKCTTYSPGDGKYFAYTQPDKVTIVDTYNNGKVALELAFKDTFEVSFSPNGTYLCCWLKPTKSIEESSNNVLWSKNVKIVHIASNSIIAEFTSKIQANWKPQFTKDEKIMAKLYPSQVRFYDLSKYLQQLNQPLINFDKPTFSLALENISTYSISPGNNPSIAIFVPEKAGIPASVKLYNVSPAGFKQPLHQSNFFKAERCSFKWNSLGTSVLALASTDVDSSNKSYYGESSLYLLSINPHQATSKSGRIALDKEGPIYDTCWSPNSREFAVVYGYMPSTTSFFDARGQRIHQLPPKAYNTILYSPHARFILCAGFGNLQGTVDIYDRASSPTPFKLVSTFNASNTSCVSWSPCGRFILTGTTSPRLRVDNAIRIWHATGKLVYLEEFKELLSVDWRPSTVDKFPALKQLEKPADVKCHQSVVDWELKRAKISSDNNSSSSSDSSASSKPKGAYRPPHQRNKLQGASSVVGATSELATPGATFKPLVQPKTIPGAPVPVTAESKLASKNRRKREARRAAQSATPSAPAATSLPAPEITVPTASTGSVVGGVFSLEEKKIRNLLKKLRAIETLKMKQALGENLENTQILKISTEDKVREELTSLGWTE